MTSNVEEKISELEKEADPGDSPVKDLGEAKSRRSGTQGRLLRQ